MNQSPETIPLTWTSKELAAFDYVLACHDLYFFLNLGWHQLVTNIFNYLKFFSSEKNIRICKTEFKETFANLESNCSSNLINNVFLLDPTDLWRIKSILNFDVVKRRKKNRRKCEIKQRENWKLKIKTSIVEIQLLRWHESQGQSFVAWKMKKLSRFIPEVI